MYHLGLFCLHLTKKILDFLEIKLYRFYKENGFYFKQNSYELTNLIVDTLSKLLVFSGNQWNRKTSALWGWDVKPSTIYFCHHIVIDFETCKHILWCNFFNYIYDGCIYFEHYYTRCCDTVHEVLHPWTFPPSLVWGCDRLVSEHCL